MMSFKTALGLLVLAVVAVVSEYSSNKDKDSYSSDLSISELNNLYNSEVYLAELFTRPLDRWPFQISIFSHSGVRVTLEDGSKWLVHKGDDFGISSETVVVDGNHMSSKWKFKKEKDFHGTKTVSDFVRAGRTDYNLWFDNCHNAANRMMNG